MPTLDIELLKTFHAIARLGKFRAAAQLLHKSPAAISVHVQRLEALAGGRLLERDNQAVTLTALGLRVLGATGALLSAHDQALAHIQGPPLEGRVTLGVPDEYVVHVIEDILPAFAAQWPQVAVEVVTAPSYSLVEQVQQGHLQLAVASQPLAQPRADGELLQRTTPVWVCGLRYVANPGSPLPLALYAAPCPYHDAAREALAASGQAWRVVLDTQSGQAVRACIEAGLAIGIVDRGRITERMRLLSGLPALPEHRILLLRQPRERSEAATVLARMIGQRFVV
ncbi:LysR substrate-binding domain-containing protein [Pseudomonas sp. NPDC007930]|uniref:LysR substrate-binding domain-containing protein n=1 Tax=Pseudomonas sp. NPDC007930 TaxID=3364417 RepID=UPI0036EEA4CB